MQIEKLEYVANQRTIIRAITPTGRINIKYTDIRPYWPEARPSLLEGGRSFVTGNYLIFTMITASGQDGVICVWDCASNRLVHISDGAYCIAAAIDNGTLYSLRDISNYCMPYHLRVYSCPFGTMDSSNEGTVLYAESPIKIENYVETVPSAELRVANGRITVVVGGEEILFAADEKDALTMNEDFSSYYKPAQESMEISLSIRRGMLL